jgi:tape measure domain-containing protein
MVADLAVNISANIKDLQRNIGKAKATLKNFGNSAGALGAGLTASLTLSIASLGGVALKTASDFEQLEVRLQTLTGSAKAGRKQFELLQKFSAGTPFQLQDLVKANNTLLGFGLSAEDSFIALQQLGDVASATGADLQSIAVAFGQSSAEGKLFTRDIRQFINQGVPAVDLLAESMGVARSEVFTLAEEGKISFKVLQDAISQATSAGGKFAGATKAQSQTIAGLFSTLRDNVSLALGELGKELVRAFDLDKLVTDLTNKVKAVTTVFKAMSSDVKKQMLIFAGVLGASGPALLALKGIIAVITFLSIKFVALVAVVSGIGFIFKSAFEQSGSFVGMFQLIFTKMVNGVIDDLINLTGALSNLPFGVGSAFKLVTGELIKFKSDTKEQSDAFTPLQVGFEKMKDTFDNLSSFINRVRLQMSDGFQAEVEGVKLNKTSIRDNIEIPLRMADGTIANFGQTATESMSGVAESTQDVGSSISFAGRLAEQFTSSFGQGMANIVVQGEKLQDVLKNIGKLLLSSAIQLGIQLLLTGGTGGSITGGLFGALGFGKTSSITSGAVASAGSVVGSINNNNMQLSGDFRVKGSDLVLSLERANQVIGR